MGEGSVDYSRQGCEFEDSKPSPSITNTISATLYGMLVAAVLVAVASTVSSQLDRTRFVGGKYG